ncbi:MAG TPA: hypothetical protein GXX25_02280 [Desulfotomaculum sp.]|nr:hypothetical protein [Desulfotomaculum sp.]
MHVKVKTVTCLLVVALLLLGSLPAWAGLVNVTADPDRIDVGLNFSGRTVTITGTAPPDSDIYIKLVSPARNVMLNKKGRVGFLWMNVAQAEVEGIPKMYQIYSSAPIDRLSPILQEETGIDKNYDAVRSTAVIKETAGNNSRRLSGADGKDYLDALINMYQKNNLYLVNEKAVERNGSQFYLTVNLPGSAAHGDSLVTAYAVKNGRILGQSESKINVQPVGVVGWARTMAKTNGPLYGTYAVLIALAAGLLIDLLFNYLEKLIGALTGVPGKVPGKTGKGREVSAEIH